MLVFQCAAYYCIQYMARSEFDLTDVPLNCWNCQRICDAVENAAGSAENLDNLQHGDHRETIATIGMYLTVLATIESSHAEITKSTQSLISGYAKLSRIFKCEGNDPETGQCQIERAILRNPYR